MFDPLEIARSAVKTYLSTGKMSERPSDVPEEWLKPGGVFVCMKKNGQLRGCIGTYLPVRSTLVDEIMHNAVSSARDDPRFLPVTADELPLLQFSVDVLEPPEQVLSIEQLDPKIYGVLVRGSGGRSGLLLPDLEGVETVEKQLSIARQKGGISEDEPAILFRFRVTRYG